MLWHTSITSQRLMPRGEVALTCSGRPGVLAGDLASYKLRRWRS